MGKTTLVAFAINERRLTTKRVIQEGVLLVSLTECGALEIAFIWGGIR
jgi:hypothetical protein